MSAQPFHMEFFKNSKKAGTDEISELDKSIRDPLPQYDMGNLFKPVMLSIITTNNDCKDHECLETFEVPKELICRHSVWFRAAFEGRFVESTRKEISLDDVCSKVFQRFVVYLYTQDIVMHRDQDASHDFSLSFLFEMYIFADKYDCRRFRQRVFETIQLKLGRAIYWSLGESDESNFPNEELIKKLCENTTSSAPLRKFLVECALGLGIGHVTWPDRDYGDEFITECRDRADRKTKAFRCPHCGICGDGEKCEDSNHESADRKVGLFSDWCKFHEHKTEEERLLCVWRKEAMKDPVMGSIE